MKKTILLLLVLSLWLGLFSLPFPKKFAIISSFPIYNLIPYFTDNSQKDFDRSLAKALLEFFLKEKTTSIADFGCGACGHYVRFFLNHGLFCEGYDIDPLSKSLSDGLVQYFDLSEPGKLNKTFDWILSLHVGQYIPNLCKKNYIDNLDLHNREGIILCWSSESATTSPHLNLQEEIYIKNLFASYGYINDIAVENVLKNKAKNKHCKTNLLVFRKKRSNFGQKNSI